MHCNKSVFFGICLIAVETVMLYCALTGLSFVFPSLLFTHFVAFRRHLDDELEAFPNFERHPAQLVLRAPAAPLKGVENHFVPAVKPGVHVHGYVAVLRRVTAQVDDEPAQAPASQLSFSSEKLKWSF